MARSKITEHPIISGAALLFIGWAASMFFPQSRGWWIAVAKQAGQGIGRGWSWIWSPLPVPRVLVMLVSFLVLVWLARRVILRFQSTEVEPQPLRGLTDDEKKILQMLAAADGGVVWFNAIQQELGSSRLKTEHTITMLQARSLIAWSSDFQYGGSATLTPFGKAACVSYGWAK